MNTRLCAFALFFSIAVSSAAALDAGTIPLVKRADWISPVALDESGTIDDSLVNYGFYYILNDQQISVARKEHYHHYAYRVVNNAGVEEASEISVDWDASYEKLAIHSISVCRGGKAFDYSDKVRWSELQREEALDYGMYDGTKTLLVVLEDIREGDVVEYDYTVSGSNPIFGSRFYGSFSHGLDYPMLSLRFRLVAPLGRDIAIRQHVRDLPQTVRALPGNDVEYVWEETDSVAVESEDYAPDWYDAYPWIEMGEWGDWERVRDWGIETFAAAADRARWKRKRCQRKRWQPLARRTQSVTARSSGLRPHRRRARRKGRPRNDSRRPSPLCAGRNPLLWHRARRQFSQAAISGRGTAKPLRRLQGQGASLLRARANRRMGGVARARQLDLGPKRRRLAPLTARVRPRDSGGQGRRRNGALV